MRWRTGRHGQPEPIDEEAAAPVEDKPDPSMSTGGPVFSGGSISFSLPYEGRYSLSTTPRITAKTPTEPGKGPFGGYGFAAGSVTGLRSFRVDALGRLTGVTVKQVWTPGENTAECRKPDTTMRGITHSMYASMYGLPSSMFPDDPPARPEGPHDISGCTCGFYAYFDGCNDYADKTTVAGVIEGFGKTTIGTRGFRCEKARVIALVIPAVHRTSKPGLLKGTDLRPSLLTRVQRNYPDLAIFTTEYDMTSEYPVTDESTNPASDPDFWTRKAV